MKSSKNQRIREQSEKKTIVCLLHGLSDEPLKDLGGLTPLQKASCFYLDSLVQKGKPIVMQTPSFGGFETAFLRMLGIQEGLDSLAQAALEAYSLGYVLTPTQLAFSLRFVSLGQNVVVDVSDHLLSDHEGKRLCSDLNSHFAAWACHFLHLKGPEAVLLCEKSLLQSMPKKPSYNPLKAIAKNWVDLLMEEKGACLPSLLREIQAFLQRHELNELKLDLEEAQANGFLLFNGGSKLAFAPEQLKLQAKNVQIYSRCSKTLGIAKMLDIDVFQWPKEKQKYEHLIKLLGKLDDVFSRKDVLIIEAHQLWDSTYHGSLLDKVKGIEWLDRYIIKHLYHFCQTRDCQLFVLPLRHSSIQSGQILSGDVPAIFFSNQFEGSDISKFDESMLKAPLPKKCLSQIFSKEIH